MQKSGHTAFFAFKVQAGARQKERRGKDAKKSFL
jgi:hypothetical protein